MTKASGTAVKVKTPSEPGEYRVYVTDSTGKVLSKSTHLVRISGSASTVDASSYSVQSGIELENCQEGGQDVAFIEDGDYIGFKDVDFGDGADKIDIRVAANSGGSSIEVRLDGANGKLIGTVDVASTGGWQDWQTMSASLTKTTGVHDLYLVFKGGEGYLFNVAWWKLNVPPGSVTKDFIYGDLNDDKSVDARDLTLLKRAVLTGEIEDIDPADLDGNGEVDADDVKLHINYLTGKISVFPVMA